MDACDHQSIDRASPADLAMRAMDSGRPPMHLGAVVVLDPGPAFDVEVTRRVVAERIATVPRMRQRLVRQPLGCGRPVWVDDPAFDPAQHVRLVVCPGPGDERALLDLTAEIVTAPFPAEWPQWSATLVIGLSGGQVGLVVVLDHMLADGLSGLAVLGRLVDGAPSPPARAFPLAPPSRRRLAIDALRTRLATVARTPAAAREFLAAFRAAGGWGAEQATRCSLLRPVGARRTLAVVRTDLPRVRAVAHRNGGTGNDALLVAIAGALHTLLEHRGEHVETFQIAIPVAARRPLGPGELGNANTPLIVTVPGAGEPGTRLRDFAGTVRAARLAAAGPSLPALLGPAFRLLSTFGGYRWYMNRQRRLHTLVSHVRGPDHIETLAGAPIRTIVPLAVGDNGNVTMTFVALSYAGTLAVTVVADSDTVPDLPVLTSALQGELEALACREVGTP